MTPRDRIRAEFLRMVSRPEPAIGLAHAALLVAAESDPRLDVEGELRTLAGWVDDLRARIEPGWTTLQRLARLRSFTFEHLRFRGDRADYHSPSNALLHEVIQRRRGIPLTLAIIFMELGWSIGLALEGVGFPGHFLVRLAGEPKDLLLDPFQGGTTVHEEDCRRMLQELSGGRTPYEPRLIASVGKRAMITRLLLNLKGAYLRTGKDELALAAVERLLLLSPDDLEEVRDRGLLLYRLQRYGPALESLGAYLAGTPDAADRDGVASVVAEVRRQIASLN